MVEAGAGWSRRGWGKYFRGLERKLSKLSLELGSRREKARGGRRRDAVEATRKFGLQTGVRNGKF
jgi:hypothetical protein